MKSLVLKRNKASEIFNKGFLFLGVEEKQNYNDKNKIDYNVNVLDRYTNTTMIITCDEPVPKELKDMEKVDFNDCEVTFKGKGTPSFNGVPMAELVVQVKAKNCIIVK